MSANNFSEEIARGDSFMDIIRDCVADRLDEMEGMRVYGCDLTSEITMPDNMDGCFVIYTEAAKEFIKAYWDEAAETFEQNKADFGSDWNENPFDNACRYTFFMEDYGVRNLLEKSELIDQMWNDEIELTPEIICQIKKEIGVYPEVIEKDQAR